MTSLRSIMVVVALLGSGVAQAGYGIGTVGQVLVGRNGSEVYVELLSATIEGWPCVGTTTGGWRYAFLLSNPGSKEMLATVLAAKAMGQRIQIVGHGVCTIDASLETVSHVNILQLQSRQSPTASIYTTGKGEPAASAVEAGSLDGGRGVRTRSTGDTIHETKLAEPLGSVDRNRRMRNRTSGGVGGRRA